MKQRIKYLLFVLFWFSLAGMAVIIIYSMILKIPHYRTAVETRTIRFFTNIYISMLLVFWIYYNLRLIPRIKLRDTHMRTIAVSHILHYLVVIGISYTLTIFIFDLSERVYFHYIYFTDTDIDQIIIKACPPIFLIGIYYIYLKESLKLTRTKLGVIKLASWRAYEDKEFDLSVEYVKEILEIDPNRAQVFLAWGNTLVGKARTKSGLEQDALYQEASAKFEQAYKSAPKEPWIYHSWGYMLADQARHLEVEPADALFVQAYDKFEKSFGLKNDNSKLFGDWGWALINQAKKKEGEESIRLLETACEKFEEANELQRDKNEICNFTNWAWALSERSEYEEGAKKIELLKSAEEKLQQGLAIKPRDIYALINYGVVLTRMATLRYKEKRIKLLRKAEKKLKQVEQIKKGEGAYNLACIYALRGEEAECHRWLALGEEMGTLPTKNKALEDDCLVSVREKEWFQAIRWGEEEGKKT